MDDYFDLQVERHYEKYERRMHKYRKALDCYEHEYKLISTCDYGDRYIQEPAPCFGDGSLKEENSMDLHPRPLPMNDDDFLVALANRPGPAGKPSFTLPPSRRPGEDVVAVENTPEEAEVLSPWLLARKRYEEVQEAWATLITDPLNALTHAALFDVTVPKTQAFIEVLGELQDFTHVYTTEVQDSTVVDKFAALARRCEMLWQAALAYASRVSYDWLPEAEQKHARQADGLLRMAADENLSLAARANYAAKAQELINKIYTIELPIVTQEALHASSRLAIES